MTPLQKPKAIAAEGDGPCKLFSSGHRWVLGDTFRQPHKLYVWDLYRSDVFTVNIFGTADWPGPEYARTSLNPQWSPDGEPYQGVGINFISRIPGRPVESGSNGGISVIFSGHISRGLPVWTKNMPNETRLHPIHHSSLMIYIPLSHPP